MREMFTSHLGKLVENTKDHMICSSAEQTAQDKETTANSLQGSRATLSGKADHLAPLPTEKSKKHRIPFIALALMMLFTSLCIFSVVGLRPTALADKLTHLDDSPTATPADPEAAPPDQSVSQLLSMGNITLGYGDKCEEFRTVTGDDFCWNEDDFWWGARDITCIHNPSASDHSHDSKETIQTEGTTATSVDLSAAIFNQNTCTNNSTCVSDNSSHDDAAGSQIHSQVGGDDILCGNNTCTNVSAGGNKTECGDKTGKQLAYDRFGCKTVNSDISTTNNGTTVSYSAGNGTGGSYKVSDGWDAEGVAINPTAYDPNGAFYLPTTKLSKRDIEAGSTKTRPTCGSNNRWVCATDSGVIPNVVIYEFQGNFVEKEKKHEVTMTEGSTIPVFWVVCDTITGGWAFPCSDVPTNSNTPFITTDNHSQSLDNGQVSPGFIAKDWFSGNADGTTDNKLPSNSQQVSTQPGHLEYTYLNDTVNQPGVQTLLPITLGIGFAFISPVLVLIGYQLLWASWTFGRANAMEVLGRLILSSVAILASYELAAMLISLTNQFNLAIVAFHKAHPYPDITIGTQTTTFTLVPQGETDPESFRGIVVPISRWGCIANDFVALLANKFWTDLAGYIPFVGGIAKFIGNVFNMIDVAKHIGEFIVLILSISLCTQVFIRIVLLNYYILTAPVAFGCWGLPGGVGQKVVSSWAKGFCALLFSQTIQIFVLATFPLILPAFPYLPTDKFGILNVIFQALPRVLVLMATLKVPTMMGTQATKAIAQAGTVVGGAVAAAGAMAMNAV